MNQAVPSVRRRTLVAPVLLGLVVSSLAACAGEDDGGGDMPAATASSPDPSGTAPAPSNSATPMNPVTPQPTPQPTPTTPEPTPTPTPTDCNPPVVSGEEFFTTPTNCALCHGATGTGSALGPEVLHPPEDYARWIIRNGRTGHPDFFAGMTAYDECMLSDTTLDEIIAFLNAPPKPTDGQGLFEDFCANCHGDDGRGGVTTRSLDGEVHEVNTITATGHSLGAYEDRIEYMPVMTDQLTQAELDLISDYLQTGLGLAF